MSFPPLKREHIMYTHELAPEKQWYENPRRHPRFLISVPVMLSRPGRPEIPPVHGLTLDLSHGGTSAVLCGPPVVGETVCLSLQFAAGEMKSLAVVRHSSSTRSGFEFADLSADACEQLESRIKALQHRPWPRRPSATVLPR